MHSTWQLNYESNYYSCLHSSKRKIFTPFLLVVLETHVNNFIERSLTYRNMFKVYNVMILCKCIQCRGKNHHQAKKSIYSYPSMVRVCKCWEHLRSTLIENSSIQQKILNEGGTLLPAWQWFYQEPYKEGVKR